MKKLSSKILALTAIIAVTISSCIDYQFDTPPVSEIPVGSIFTIQSLRDSCPLGNVVNFTTDASLYAVVTMDETSGNLYKNAFIQDATGGVQLRFQSSSSVYEGDSIRVYLKGAKLSWYNNLFQIDSLHADSSIIKQATNKHKQPVVASIEEINLDKLFYQSRLVKIENVQIRAADTTKIWAQPQQYGEIFIEDTLGNQMMIRTSGYAKFANQNVPNGRGSLIAVVGLYRETVQLTIRRLSEVDLHGDRYDDGSLPPTGAGTFDDPYNVAKAISLNSGVKWVEGYLVGVLDDSNYPTILADFEAPFNTENNVLIADSPDITNLSKCLVVQLPAGAIRAAVNLKTNEGNWGEKIKLKGSLEAYFNQAGMKNTVGYWLNGEGIVPVTGFFDEGFTSTLGAFKGHSIIGDQVWSWASYDSGCALMTGNVGGSSGVDYDNEDWLISPVINLSGRTNVKLVFREAINYINTQTMYNDMKVFISVNYDGTSLPTVSGEWYPLDVTNRPPGNNWTFVEHNIDLSYFDGYPIHLAFKYKSNTTKAATWQIGKVMLYEQN